MSWEAKPIGKTDRRTSSIQSVSPPNKKGYSEVHMANGDVGSINMKNFKYAEGEEFSYELETVEMTNGEKSFETVNIVNIQDSFGNETKLQPVNAIKDTAPKKIITIDIETVRISRTLDPKSEEFISWQYKRRNYENETTIKDLQESYKKEAPLYAEFGKVVCVSIGRIDKNNDIVIQSYYGTDEKELLTEVGKVVDFFCSKGFKIAGFGVKGYDVPFMFRRMLVNRVPIPQALDVAGQKPWEVRIIDYNELWKSTGFYSASLLNVSHALGLPSPKASMSGNEVSDVFYKSKKGIIEVVKYCEMDVFTTINVGQFFFGLDIIDSFISKTFEDGSKD